MQKQQLVNQQLNSESQELNSNLQKLELQTHNQKQIQGQWTSQKNLNQAIILKEQGNKFYTQKNYQSALRKYHQAILHLAGIIGKGSPMAMYTKVAQQKITNEANTLKFSIYSNMSQIYIYQQKYGRGLQILKKAEQVIHTSGLAKDNTKLAKLHYRKGVCFLKSNYFQQSRKELNIVLQLDKSMGKQIQKLFFELKERQKVQDRKSQRVYQNIFK